MTAGRVFSGSLVALVTPMQPDGSLDGHALSCLVDWHLAHQTDGIVVAGTTGEASTLTDDEHFQLIAQVVRQVAGRIPVIAGTGSNNTLHAIHLTRQALEAGADAALVVTPYYNRPTQRGLIAHYEAIAGAIPLPVILYNVPARTGCDLLPETICQLAQRPGIVGVKEATGLPQRVEEILSQCPPGFAVYSGDDGTALAALRFGAQGVISVTANVVPASMHALCAAVRDNCLTEAGEIQARLAPLHAQLFVEPNPVPVKWALHEMGLIPAGIRLPLTPLDPACQVALRTVMQAAVGEETMARLMGAKKPVSAE